MGNPRNRMVGLFFSFYNTDAVLKAFPATTEKTLVSYSIFESSKIFSFPPQIIWWLLKIYYLHLGFSILEDSFFSSQTAQLSRLWQEYCTGFLVCPVYVPSAFTVVSHICLTSFSASFQNTHSLFQSLILANFILVCKTYFPLTGEILPLLCLCTKLFHEISSLVESVTSAMG